MCSDRLFLRRVASVVWTALLLLACSVKEDRDECPCFLTLDFGSVASEALISEGIDSMNVMISSDEVLCDSVSIGLADGVKEYNVGVAKSGLEVLVVCAGSGSISGEKGFRVDEGEDYPPVYHFYECFASLGEDKVCAVTLRRDFCILTVSIKTSYTLKARAFRVTASGGTAGLDRTGEPAEGPFLSGPFTSSDGMASLRLPRQSLSCAGDLSIRVEFLSGDDVLTFPIGEYILESGYDWQAADLEDISVEMDFSTSGVSFTIDKWKKTLSFDITI